MLLEMARAVIGGAVGLLIGVIMVIILNQFIIVTNAFNDATPSGPFVAPQGQMNNMFDIMINMLSPDPLAPWKIVIELLFIIGGALDANGIGVVSYGSRRRR